VFVASTHVAVQVTLQTGPGNRIIMQVKNSYTQWIKFYNYIFSVASAKKKKKNA